MAIDNFSFTGENCKISVENKRSGSSYDLNGRVTSANINGFTRNVSQERTTGQYMNNFDGYEPATVELEFIYDVDDANETPQMSSFTGSEFNTNDITAVSLNQAKPDYHKIKFEFNEYTAGSFNNLQDGNRSLRLLFYNSYGIAINSSVSAESEITGTLSFKLLPFNSIGSSNYIELKKTSNETLGSFNAAETSYDSTMGY